LLTLEQYVELSTAYGYGGEDKWFRVSCTLFGGAFRSILIDKDDLSYRRSKATPFLEALLVIVNNDTIDFSDKVKDYCSLLKSSIQYDGNYPLRIDRLVDRSWFYRTDANGLCGYLMCLQSIGRHKRILEMKKCEDSLLPFEFSSIDDAIDENNLKLNNKSGKVRFLDFLTKRQHACEQQLSILQICDLQHVEVPLFEELIDELRKVKSWVQKHGYNNLTKKPRSRAEPITTKDKWFDGQYLKYMFIPELPEVIIMSVLFMDSNQPEDKSYGYLTMRGDTLGGELRSFSYDDIVSYVVFSSNLFVYDNQHFFPQPTRRESQMGLDHRLLDEAIENLAIKHLESCYNFRLLSSFHFINTNRFFDCAEDYPRACKKFIGKQKPCNCQNSESQRCLISNVVYSPEFRTCANWNNRIDCSGQNCSIVEHNDYCENRPTRYYGDKHLSETQFKIISISNSDQNGLRAFAKTDFAVGDFILEYVGNVTSKTEGSGAVEKFWISMFTLNDICWGIDSAEFGNLSR